MERVWRQRTYPAPSEWDHCNHKGAYKREAKGEMLKKKKGKMITEAQRERERPLLALKMQNVAMNQRIQLSHRSLYMKKRQGNGFFPRTFRR